MDSNQTMLDIGEAARRLGISPDGVRKRLKRGQLPGGKGADGRWYVVLDESSALENDPEPSSAILDRLLDRLDERDRQIAELQRERAELFGRLGYFQAELDQARERVKLLEAPRRRRWKFW